MVKAILEYFNGKNVIFHVIFASFLAKSSDVVAMATEVELNEKALDFLFLYDH